MNDGSDELVTAQDDLDVGEEGFNDQINEHAGFDHIEDDHLHGEMNNQQNAASIRVRAAHALLTTALQWRDADIDERLTSLEELARQH